ncbi:MAG: YggS family pyridoxal phosphate-dependent enzyme [Deltaproteobacteria bacterium]|nr:YggS family pyridoxal phosphate-dependent enzyme [Deltaproteobacteria bacterium]
MISENIQKINNDIKRSVAKSGRNYQCITILAASKTRNADEIIKACESGITVFGENYVQEFLGKYDYFKNIAEINHTDCDSNNIPSACIVENLEWHLIGKLQKNKVKYIAKKVNMIHSVDSFELAKFIDKFSVSDNLSGNKVQILIEINIADESTKSGIKLDNAKELIYNLNSLNNIELKGFMTMPPYAENPEQNRIYFKALKDFIDFANQKNMYKNELTELSMGTSNDFAAAIEEGATIVRLGTIIFGERIYAIRQ